MVQEAIERIGRAVWKTEKDSFSVRVAAPDERREAMLGSSLIGSISGLPFGPISFQNASASAWLVIFRIRGLMVHCGNDRRVRSVDFQVRDPVSGRRVFSRAADLEGPLGPAALRETAARLPSDVRTRTHD